MQKRGFSLIQLIFVIVIIGILAAVAIPKFSNIQKQSEIKSLFRTVNDIIKHVPSSFIHKVEIEGDSHDWNIEKYYHIKGKGWSYQNGDYFKVRGKDTHNAISYKYKGKNIVWISLGIGDKRMMAVWITCGEYEDETLVKLCNQAANTYVNKSKHKDGRELKYREKLIEF